MSHRNFHNSHPQTRIGQRIVYGSGTIRSHIQDKIVGDQPHMVPNTIDRVVLVVRVFQSMDWIAEVGVFLCITSDSFLLFQLLLAGSTQSVRIPDGVSTGTSPPSRLCFCAVDFEGGSLLWSVGE